MRHEIKRIGKIVDELVTFFLSRGSNSINMAVINYEDKTEMIFDVDTLDEKDPIVNILQELINLPKEEDFDEIYWCLAGESDHDTELSLIGYMCDDVTFCHADDTFKIKLTRYKSNRA